MKLNWAERWVVNNPLRVLEQSMIIGWMAQAVPVGFPSPVLEVGCGRGAGIRLIRKAFRADQIAAMDLDPDMMVKVRSYLSTRELDGVSLYVGDLSALPCPDSAFGAVFGFGVLHHLPDWQAGVREIGRVLKSGGFYYMEELYPFVYQNAVTKHILLHPRGNRFRGNDLKAALAREGLSMVAHRENRFLGIMAVCRKK